MTLDAELVAAALPAYDIGGELGRGGWGVVLAGRHRTLDRRVAIKQLPRAFAADAAVRSRFIAEARTLAALSHPHIVPVYDYVEQEGLCLLVMEALPGGTVWDRFLAQGYSTEASVAVVMASLAGLGAAHERGVLHRDVKPENLMYAADGVLKVTDFGISKMVGGGRTLATRAGEVLGTPAYMAPEQAMGADLAAGTDVYAAAVVLYELLAGKLPFPEEGDALAILYRHVHEDPVDLGAVAPQVGAQLSDVVMRGLARSPDDRYASAEDFAVALGGAATAHLGAGWADRSGTLMMATARVMATTTGSVRAAAPRTVIEPPPGGGPAPATVAPVRTAPPVAPTAEPGVDDAAEPAARAELPPTVTTAPTAVVKGTVAEHRRGARADDVDIDDLVSVAEVSPTRRAGLAAAVAIVLLVLALAIGLIGPGSPDLDGDLTSGDVLVADVDPTSGASIEIDLAGVPVEIGPAVTGTATEVEVTLSAMGVPLGSATETIAPGGGGVEVSLSGSRFLVAGDVTAEIVLRDASGSVRSQQFVARPSGSGLLTAPAIVCAVAVLLLGAYAESFMRSLRRGRHRRRGQLGLVVVGSFLGAVSAVAGWVLGSGEPVLTTVVPGMVLGGAAGIAAGVAALSVAPARTRSRGG